ncbi:hypothetical protein [Massilia varians]|uniref:hypothetical protein n=1 Tax=Massilia varians TaxID=457921 RepID=UPI002553FF67|nr:hypothetical protein [Massilia varians]MDK6077911.1 hypothetical protein [Massilia varians]
MNQTTTQLAVQQNTAPVRAGFMDAAGFDLMQRVSKAFASSTLVPQQYQNNIPNCMIALNLAQRLKADELMVMQNLYIVHGNPGWSSKFLIASVNTCGRFSALRYEWRGTEGQGDFGCRAWAIERESGERLDGAWVDWNMVRAEGWDKKNGSKWKTMPQQMFIYRAASFWQRAYAPEISMGLSTAEELQDVIDVAPDGSYTISSEPRADARPGGVVDHQGSGAAAQLPVCTAEHFDSKKAEWRDLVQSGKKTVAQLIAMIETRQVLTEEQKLTIDSWTHEND